MACACFRCAGVNRVATRETRHAALLLGYDIALGHGREGIFRYLDELAAACSAGYAEARAEFAGEAERLRHRLLDLLVADPPTPPETIAGLAATIGWRLPNWAGNLARNVRNSA